MDCLAELDTGFFGGGVSGFYFLISHGERMGLQRGKINRKGGSYQLMITQPRPERRFNATELAI